MDTKKYEVLEKTVELSSLTKAAQELGLTQSGVSHMLAAIEAELREKLKAEMMQELREEMKKNAEAAKDEKTDGQN